MTTRLRLLVVGLDGASFDVMQPLLSQGRMPVLASLIGEGASGPLRSTVPPVSAPAWSTFMTGLNPGKHGIFQWRTYDPTKYTGLDERLMTSSRLAGRTFWDTLSSGGYRVGVITVPMTYPPWRVNGFMVSGYPCPDDRQNYAYPSDWADELEEAYNFSADHYSHASEDVVWESGLRMLERRTTLAARLIQEQKLEVCVVVLGEIDRAQHDFWKYTDPRFAAYQTSKGGRYREVIAEHYMISDAQVGRLLELAGTDTLVVIMSDHGGGPHPPRLFHTNAWLRSHAWLRPAQGRTWGLTGTIRSALATLRRHLPMEERLRRALPARVVDGVRRFSLNIADVDWTNTKAYRFPMYHPVEGIAINLRGRQPEGVVEPGPEQDSLRERIITALEEACDPEGSGPMVSRVWRREELYTGPYVSLAPDIVFMTRPQFRADSGLRGPFVGRAPLSQLNKYSGLHTMEGVFVARGSMVRSGHRLSEMEIADVAPTLLYALDQPISEDIDGRVRKDVFVPSWAGSRRVRVVSRKEASESSDQGLTDEEEEQMRAKLRALGYLD